MLHLLTGLPRSTFHDDLNRTSIWDKFYDGRAIVTDSYRDYKSGVSLEENLEKLNAANAAGDNSRQVVWA